MCRVSPQPARPEQVAEALTARARMALGRKLASIACTLPGDRRTMADLLKLQSSLTCGKDAEEDGAPKNIMEMHIKAMLEEIPWVVGDRAAKNVPPQIAEFDAGAVELTADELLRLSDGQKLPYLDAIKDMKMPSPRPRAEKPNVLGSEDALA